MVGNMGHRDAPTAPHPAPAPDWILGDDGHWRPPPFLGDAPRRVRSTTVVDPDAPPPPHKVGAGVIVSVILVIVAVAYLAWIALLS
jgi:hypothetical protein